MTTPLQDQKKSLVLLTLARWIHQSFYFLRFFIPPDILSDDFDKLAFNFLNQPTTMFILIQQLMNLPVARQSSHW